MNELRVLGALDRTFAWDGSRLYEDAELEPGAPPPVALRGAAGSVRFDQSGRWRIVRDPLGINKLFWADADGTVSVAARPWRLTRDGQELDSIHAIPRGVIVDGDPARSEPARHPIRLGAAGRPNGAAADGVAATAGAIRAAVDRYLAAIAAANPGAPTFVCLSGGLDSSGIAVLAREHFPQLTAVSFDLDRQRGTISEDRRVARRLARDLRLPLLEATVAGEKLLDHLDTALLEGIDWRDFNVHAALVNAALAETIAGAAGAARPVLVLTGDMANEFMADYQPERYGNSTYYGLPRLARPALRRILVRGLDTSHREVGVFEAWGLSAVQPYATAVDAYLALPDAFLEAPDCKTKLCRELFARQLPDYVYERPKARAQTGGDGGGGVLGLCVDRGIDAVWLKRHFADLHGVGDPTALDRFIRAGLYRNGVPSTTGITDGRA